jgi:redox-sensitive bicupin YhaK (pirin superfamily)
VPDAPYLYVHVVRGEVRLDGEELGPGDAVRITDAKDLEAVAVTGAELLVWEMTP